MSNCLYQVRIHTTATGFNARILLEHSRDVEFAVSALAMLIASFGPLLVFIMPARQSARRDRSLGRGRPKYIPARTTRIGHRAPTPIESREQKIVGSYTSGLALTSWTLYWSPWPFTLIHRP